MRVSLKHNIKTFGRGFIEGLTSLFHFQLDEPQSYKSQGFDDDYASIKKDWEHVSADMNGACRKFEAEHDIPEEDQKGVPA